MYVKEVKWMQLYLGKENHDIVNGVLHSPLSKCRE